jgi:hemolysin III
MDTTLPSGRKVEAPFSPVLFIITVILTLAAIFGALAFCVPSIWATQIHSSSGTIIKVFLTAHLIAAGFEFVFHRYVFHKHPIRILMRFYTQHTIHHGLTNVKLLTSPDGKRVFNRYAIVKEKQYEASYFPWFSLGAFIGVSSPVLIGAQLLMPHLPILYGGILAIAWSMILYELIHALEHLDYETFWKSRIEHSVFGSFWKVAYCFHLRHHANILCNEAVGGFFGLPVFDWLCRTYMSSRLVLLDGVPAIEQDFEPPRPIWPIRVFDTWADYFVSLQKKPA